MLAQPQDVATIKSEIADFGTPSKPHPLMLHGRAWKWALAAPLRSLMLICKSDRAEATEALNGNVAAKGVLGQWTAPTFALQTTAQNLHGLYF